MQNKNLFQIFEQLLTDGGFVLPMLLLCAALVWWFLGARAAILLTPSISNTDLWANSETNSQDSLIEKLAHQIRAIEQHRRTPIRIQALWTHHADMLNRHRKLILTIIAIAPLLGLLGTVTGMMETFQGLGQSSLYTQSGGVAGGIAEALLTTQMGLLVAAPAILMSKWLDRRAELLEQKMFNFMTWVPKCEE